MAGDMGIATEGMTDENGVIFGWGKLAISFVGNGDFRQHAAQFQLQGAAEHLGLEVAERFGASKTVTAVDHE